MVIRKVLTGEPYNTANVGEHGRNAAKNVQAFRQQQTKIQEEINALQQRALQGDMQAAMEMMTKQRQMVPEKDAAFRYADQKTLGGDDLFYNAFGYVEEKMAGLDGNNKPGPMDFDQFKKYFKQERGGDLDAMIGKAKGQADLLTQLIGMLFGGGGDNPLGGLFGDKAPRPGQQEEKTDIPQDVIFDTSLYNDDETEEAGKAGKADQTGETDTPQDPDDDPGVTLDDSDNLFADGELPPAEKPEGGPQAPNLPGGGGLGDILGSLFGGMGDMGDPAEIFKSQMEGQLDEVARALFEAIDNNGNDQVDVPELAAHVLFTDDSIRMLNDVISATAKRGSLPPDLRKLQTLLQKQGGRSRLDGQLDPHERGAAQLAESNPANIVGVITDGVLNGTNLRQKYQTYQGLK